jgi:hypothetical protein
LEELKIYNLQPLVSNPAPTQKMLNDLGFTVEEFSFHNDPEAGVEFRVPDLKRRGYEEGTLWIYNPKVAHGSFEDEEYTRQWRTYHEAGHAISEPLMQTKYGESKREGRLGMPGVGVRGDPAKRTVNVPLKPLTLMQAQRAIEWEDVAFRTQRILLKDYGGVSINEDAFAREHNVNIADATFRVLTGDFGDPGKYGYRPSNQRARTRDLLGWLENQENLIAKSQGRTATKGIDLDTWRPVTDSEIRAHIAGHVKRKRADDRLSVLLLDVLFDGISIHKGGPGSGHHGHSGRPGEVGGSVPGGWTGTTPTSPAVIPDDQFQAVREDIAALPQKNLVPPQAEKAIEEGFQEFARDAEARAGVMDWEVDGRNRGTAYAMTLSGSKWARMWLEVQARPDGEHDLYVDYVSMPGQFQKKGMGMEIVTNVMRTAHAGGFKSVIYDAVSDNGPLKGAYVWAKMGATFANEEDRTRVVRGYLTAQGLVGLGPGVREENIHKMSTWEPGDILKAPGGGEYLLGRVHYHGKFDVQ